MRPRPERGSVGGRPGHRRLGGDGTGRPPGPPKRRRPPVSARERRAESARFRRSLLLTGLSIVAPGSAQLIAGSRRVGKIALSIWLGLLAAGGLVLWLVPLDQLARLAVRPWVLTSFKFFAFTLAAAWVVLILDAWRLGRPPTLSQRHRLVMVAATLTVATLVATPFVVAARYATAAHDAVVSLFPSGEVAAASDGRLNFLLLGLDAGDGRAGVRPDSINLVSVDVRSGTPVMISLPRNLEQARFPDGSAAAAEFPRGFQGDDGEDPANYFLNATWTFGDANPELFPGERGPGPTAVMQAVEGTLGVPVHSYIGVDMMGFRELVDALGGVTIEITEDVPIGEKGRVLKPGVQTLDGYEALWYGRSRADSSDYARMARQRCVIGAFVNQADPETVLRNFLDLAEASSAMLTTDIPREQLPDLVNLALTAKSQKMSSLQLVPPLITPGDPDIGVIREQVQLALNTAIEAPTPEEPDAPVDEDPAEEPPPTAEPVSEDEPTVEAASVAEETDEDDTEQDDPEESDPKEGEEDAEEPIVDVSSACSYG